MSKENHTPEPWTYHDASQSLGNDSIPQVVSWLVAYDSKAEVNGQRIAACVNAMKGIEDPAKYVTDNNDLKDLLTTLVEVSKNTETISTKSLVFEALVHAMQKYEK